MKVPRKSEIPHKLAMYRLLEQLLANPMIANHIYFKGGTCAAMLGYLDRYSIDLDFDLINKSMKDSLRQEIHQVIKSLNYTIKDESTKHLQFFIKYRDVENKRNTLKLEISDQVSVANKYQKVHLVEIDKYCQTQTIETMFANKLVALKARYDEGKGIAGRDMYDIHHFFTQGYDFIPEIIEDLKGKSWLEYIEELIVFIEKEVTEQYLYEDINPLVSAKKLGRVVPVIKGEVLIALRSLVSGNK